MYIYICIYIYMDIYIYARHSFTNQPLTESTHAHLIGVSGIGASLQHRAQTGRESQARTD